MGPEQAMRPKTLMKMMTMHIIFIYQNSISICSFILPNNAPIYNMHIATLLTAFFHSASMYEVYQQSYPEKHKKPQRSSQNGPQRQVIDDSRQRHVPSMEPPCKSHIFCWVKGLACTSELCNCYMELKFYY
jgi:hypothetical protein